MDTPVLCPQCIVCVLNLCRLFPTISGHKDGLNLSLVLESCNALEICQILDTAVATMEGFPCMTPGCELLMPGGRNSSGGNTAGQCLSCYMHLFPSIQSRKLKRNPTLGKSHP